MRLLIPLFSPPTGTWGSLTRVLAVGDAARARGHETAFCASGPLADRIEAQGWRVYRTPASTLFGLPKPLSRILEARSQDATLPVRPGRSVGSIWLVLLLSGMASHRYLRRLVDAELAAARDFRADALFTEIDPGAFLVSKIAGIPLVSTYASVMRIGVGGLPWSLLHFSMERILDRHGVREPPPRDMFLDPAVLKIIPSIPELEQEIPASPEYVFAGSLLRSFGTPSDRGFALEEGRRCVFVYVGTGSVSAKRLRRVLPEVFPAGPGPICLVGAQGPRGDDDAVETKIGNVIYRPWFDAEKLMPRCDWVLCHGGHNTIIQSLTHQVPLIIFPGPVFERRFNARMVAERGAGRFAELPDFNPEWLATAMQGREECADRARELGAKITARGGARTAVEAIERWLGRRRV